jgi:hypothetical protein
MTTAVMMLSETIGLAVAITHLTLLIKTHTIVSSNFLPKSWQQTHHNKEKEKSSTSVSYHVPSQKSGEHPELRGTTRDVERASQKIHSLSLPIHVTLSNVTTCPFLQRRTVYFHATQ